MSASLTDLSVRELALGVLLAGFEGTSATGVPAWLRKRAREGLAGVTLFGRNIDDERPIEGLASLTAQLRLDRPDLLIAIDEEGGDVTRLDTVEGSMSMGQGSLGAIDDTEVTRRSAAGLAGRLARGGVNVNFAPVADLAIDRTNPVVGARAFSEVPEVAARHVVAAVTGHLDSGVAPTVKHFPGHGATADDSHLVVPVVDADLTVLQRRELVPFIAAIEAGVPLVMTGHLRVLALDAEHPATLSRRILTGLLREQLGFEGVIVTDGLDMFAISRGVGKPEGVVQALIAGADLMCIGGESVTADVVEEIVSAVECAIAAGRLPLERLVEAHGRVGRLAQTYWHNSDPAGAIAAGEPGDAFLRDAALRSLRVIGDVAVDRVAAVLELYNEPTIVAGEVAFGVGRHVAATQAEPVLVHRLEEGADLPPLPAGQLVLSTRASHLHDWQEGVVARLRLSHPDLIVVDHGATGSAELLGERAIVAYDASAIAAASAVDLMLRPAEVPARAVGS